MFENVDGRTDRRTDGRRRTDAGVTGILIAHPGAFGSGELKLEDLKVLRRSPDLLNNVKIGQGQLQLIMEQICFYHIHFCQVI